jgi:tetratricopeptide (TPR) repeat protein
MSNFKCAVVFAALVTVSGIFPETAKAQVMGTGRVGNSYYSIPGAWYNPNLPRVNPDDSKASQENLIYHRAIAEGEKGNHEAAARLFIEIIKMNPQAAYAYYDLGLTFKNNLNNRDMAVKCFRTAAKVYQQKGDTSMARESIYQISN